MTRDELNKVLLEHKLWLESDGEEGKRANLYKADLSGSDLSHANLSDAYLSDTDLSKANLFRADLSRANLSHADLYGADLSKANLSHANLSGANLSRVDLLGADLLGANLSRVDLSRANLSYANLSDVYLPGANLTDVRWNETTAFFDLQCPEEGSFVAYKKCRDDVIVKLLIPEDAKRSSATSRKCRCDKAIVLEIVNHKGDQIETAVSVHDGDFIYKVGKTLKVDSFDEDRWAECSTGIHFFMTRAEAENY